MLKRISFRPSPGPLDLAVLGRRARREVVEQVLGRVRDGVDGLVEGGLVGLARLRGAAHLADVLAAASRTSWLVAGGSKLWSCRMFRHMLRD